MSTLMPASPFGLVIPRDDAETWWQPAPSHGTMNTILSPKNCPSNAFSVATQYIDEGMMIRPHAHERAEEILFIYEGHGTLTLEGRKIPVREGSTCLVGRYVKHQLDNEHPGTMKVFIVVFPPGIEEGWRAIGKPRRWDEPAPPRYGRDTIPDLPRILDDAGFAHPDRIAAAQPADKGVGVCLGPEDGPSFWQPEPARGHVTVKLWHGSMPSNMFAMGTQTLPPGGRLAPRTFEVGEIVYFVVGGTGAVTMNGATRPVARETLVYAGRGATHTLANDGREDLTLAWVVTPPGLEVLMRQAGRPRTPGDSAPAAFAEPAEARAAYRRAGLRLP
ncbi:MAG TPA: cupin domain-containing protein [Terriglobales bacterium]|nr:cupin domain-containing protein [Terriglobales bacterium]